MPKNSNSAHALVKRACNAQTLCLSKPNVCFCFLAFLFVFVGCSGGGSSSSPSFFPRFALFFFFFQQQSQLFVARVSVLDDELAKDLERIGAFATKFFQQLVTQARVW